MTKETSELSVHNGSAELVQHKSLKMWGNHYRQVALGIKPARHTAVNKQAAKTINGLGHG